MDLTESSLKLAAQVCPAFEELSCWYSYCLSVRPSVTCHFGISHQSFSLHYTHYNASVQLSQKKLLSSSEAYSHLSCPQFLFPLESRSPRFMIRAFDVLSFIYAPILRL